MTDLLFKRVILSKNTKQINKNINQQQLRCPRRANGQVHPTTFTLRHTSQGHTATCHVTCRAWVGPQTITLSERSPHTVDVPNSTGSLLIRRKRNYSGGAHELPWDDEISYLSCRGWLPKYAHMLKFLQ